jgi:hypothetical protein
MQESRRLDEYLNSKQSHASQYDITNLRKLWISLFFLHLTVKNTEILGIIYHAHFVYMLFCIVQLARSSL